MCADNRPEKSTMCAKRAELPKICKYAHVVKLCIFITTIMKRICTALSVFFSKYSKKKKKKTK